ncbi:MAG: DUF5946 family protein [Cyclobacteriaceae bacterium]|jgi:hypothetical protein
MPWCHLSLRLRTTETPQDQFNELSYYTLAHDRTYFIHQHAVDAFAAQTADENTKPIKITFALIGLYLFLERGFTGKQVQQAHVKMSQNKKLWPSLPLPIQRGEITVVHVLKASSGEPRDRLIREWCESVWKEYHSWHEAMADLAKTELGV